MIVIVFFLLEIDKKIAFHKNNNKIPLPKRMEDIQVVIRQALYSANMPKLSKIHINWYEKDLIMDFVFLSLSQLVQFSYLHRIFQVLLI